MQAKLEIINYKNNLIRKWAAEDGFICYSAGDIAFILSIKNIKNSCKNLKVSKEMREKYQISTIKKYKNFVRRDFVRKNILINVPGLRQLIAGSKSAESANFAKFMGIELHTPSKN